MRVGMGYDVHRLAEDRKMILGGVEIPYEKGLLGHSDADVLVHAIMDALLGAAGAKLDISVVDGWTRLECCSFDAYNEAGNLREMAERFRAREGHYPSRIPADKIYRNRENLTTASRRW